MNYLFAPIRRARKLVAIAAGTCVTITLVLAIAAAQPGTILVADAGYALFAALVIAIYLVRAHPVADPALESREAGPEPDAPDE